MKLYPYEFKLYPLQSLGRLGQILSAAGENFDIYDPFVTISKGETPIRGFTISMDQNTPMNLYPPFNLRRDLARGGIISWHSTDDG